MSDDELTGRIDRPIESDTPTGQLPTQQRLQIEIAGRTDKGNVRPANEDNFGIEPSTSQAAQLHGTLFMVADGMGGHAAGEVASELAVQTVRDVYYRSRGSVAEGLQAAVAAANTAIYEDAQRVPERSGMGCTVVALVVQGSDLTTAHVGDSRAYLIRRGQIRQITRDHSWVAMQVEAGVLTPEQAERHPNRSLLMRAVGRQPQVEIELGHYILQGGDILLVCSDGLTGVVKDSEINEVASQLAPAAAAERLIALAKQRGAPDNVTVVVAALKQVSSSRIAEAVTPIVGRPGSEDTSTTTLPVQSTDPPRDPKPHLSQSAAPRPRPGQGYSHPQPQQGGQRIAPGQPARDGQQWQSPRPVAPSSGRNRQLLTLGAIAAIGIGVLLLLLILLPGPASDSRTAATPTPAPATTAAPQAAPTANATVVIPAPVPTGLPAAPAVTPSVQPAASTPAATATQATSATATPPPGTVIQAPGLPPIVLPTPPPGIPTLPPLPTGLPQFPGLPPLATPRASNP